MGVLQSSLQTKHDVNTAIAAVQVPQQAQQRTQQPIVKGNGELLLLSQDVLSHIFTYLTMDKVIGTMSRVNKMCNATIEQSQVLWSHYCQYQQCTFTKQQQLQEQQQSQVNNAVVNNQQGGDATIIINDYRSEYFQRNPLQLRIKNFYEWNIGIELTNCSQYIEKQANVHFLLPTNGTYRGVPAWPSHNTHIVAVSNRDGKGYERLQYHVNKVIQRDLYNNKNSSNKSDKDDENDKNEPQQLVAHYTVNQPNFTCDDRAGDILVPEIIKAGSKASLSAKCNEFRETDTSSYKRQKANKWELLSSIKMNKKQEQQEEQEQVPSVLVQALLLWQYSEANMDTISKENVKQVHSILSHGAYGNQGNDDDDDSNSDDDENGKDNRLFKVNRKRTVPYSNRILVSNVYEMY